MSDRLLSVLIGAGAGAAGYWGVTRFLLPRDPRKQLVGDGRPGARVAATSAPAPTTTVARTDDETAIPRDWDPIFATFTFKRGIPVAYLRALAWAESSMRPDIKGGLFQIAEVTRQDYAKRHPSDVALDLTNPLVNIAIAVDTLATIKSSLAERHPNQTNVRGDWTNRQFVELLTLAWNSGWSERGGVGKVLSLLDERGKYDATIDDIAAHAEEAGAVSWLRAYPERYRWARGVAARFELERATDASKAAR